MTYSYDIYNAVHGEFHNVLVTNPKVFLESQTHQFVGQYLWARNQFVYPYSLPSNINVPLLIGIGITCTLRSCT